MDSKELVEALRQKGKIPEGSGEDLDELRRVLAQESQSEMRIRLHATSRCASIRPLCPDNIKNVWLLT